MDFYKILTWVQQFPVAIGVIIITGIITWVTRGKWDLKKETRELIKGYLDQIELSWEELANEVISHQKNNYSGSASDHQSLIETKKKSAYSKVNQLTKILRNPTAEDIEANYYRLLDKLTSNLNQKKTGSSDAFAVNVAETTSDEFLKIIHALKFKNCRGKLKHK